MNHRWKRCPEGSTWGDFGPDDELGRINLLTPEKVRQGIAEVREAGLFAAVEFVDDAGAPASAFTAALVEEMRVRGVLVNRIGRGMNALKIRPPMVFGTEHADLLCDTLEAALAAVAPLRG